MNNYLHFRQGQKVKCILAGPLEGNDKAPPVVEGDEYEIKEIILDSQGFQHLDVGIKSNLSFVRSWDTKEELQRSDDIHWCHPSRFYPI